MPDDRAANRGLTVRCRCGAEFALHRLHHSVLLLGAFVAAYAWLAAGCALGLAVFKKARELNLD